MGKKRRVLAVFAVMVICGLFLEACGNISEGTAHENTITVWSHLSDDEVESVKELAQKWGKDKGIKVNIIQGKGDRQECIDDIEHVSSPDIVYGMEHDVIGTLVNDGIAVEVPSGLISSDDYISKKVVDAVTIDNKTYAVPISEETCALYYNKDKINRVPDTMEDLEKMTTQYGIGFQFDITDLYKCYGFIAAQGGDVFKYNNESFDENDIGLNNEGTVKGYEFLRKLVVEDNLMTKDINEQSAKNNFQSGNNAFYISGPEDIGDFKNSKPELNFGVAAIPSLNGQTVASLLSVQVAFVNSNSKNKDLSWELLKYLNKNNNDIINKGNRIPVTKDDFNTSENKEFISGFEEQAESSVLIPNIPEMQIIWKSEEEKLKSVLSN